MKRFFAVMLTVLAAAAFAAETAVELQAKKNVVGWGSPKCYQTPPVITVADGVAKVTCGELVADAKVTNYQFSVLTRDRTFKAGVKYTFTFTVKSNMDVKRGYAFCQINYKPYTTFARQSVVLTANEPKTFTLVSTPEKDVTGITRTPCLHIPLAEGQTVEISDVKIAEEEAK